MTVDIFEGAVGISGQDRSDMGVGRPLVAVPAGADVVRRRLAGASPLGGEPSSHQTYTENFS